jgi:hypothetical protein
MLTAIKSLVPRPKSRSSTPKPKRNMALSNVVTPNGSAEITMLADLISASVKDVVAEYQNAGHNVPSLSTTESGPFDAPHLQSAKLTKAIQIIEAACAQLSFAVASPGHVVTNVSSVLCSLRSGCSFIDILS